MSGGPSPSIHITIIMKKNKSIHERELRFRDQIWRFEFVRDPVSRTPGIRVTQGKKTFSSVPQMLTLYDHHLPSFIAFLRQGLQEIRETRKKRTAV